MNIEWNYLSLVVFLSWILTASFSGLPVVILSGLILFSNSISINLLLLMTLTLVSFITTARSARKEATSLAQKYYAIRFFGILIALLGSIVYPPMMMFGLLISLPIFLWSLLFDRHFESMTVRTYLYSTIVPAVATLVVLGRIKPIVKADYGQLWDISFAVIGLTTLLMGSVLGFLKKKTKSLVIALAQSWIGLAIFLLMIDADPIVHYALSALFCFTVTGPILMTLGKQLGVRAETLSRIVMLGMPGFLSFSMVFYSIKSIAALNVHWIWFIVVAFLFQVLAMMVNGYAPESSSEDVKVDKGTWVRFGLVIAVQLFCSAGLYWLDLSGAK
jgi:hypothetical protein